MRFRGLVSVLALVPAMLAGQSALARAETVSVAVAANFAQAVRAIGAAFKVASGNDLSVSPGATGQLYTQISQGAPFEVLLSADTKTARKAVEGGFAVAGTEFTYAVGRLVLFSTQAGLVTGAETLEQGKFDKLAIANPKTAPYGASAVEVLRKLGVEAALAPRLVIGESIAQTYQFVDSGNAELGFVALSQVIGRTDGSRWLVPPEDHAPITQDAVLLNPGRDSQAAKDFLAFLRSEKAVGIIRKFGYGVGAD